MEKEVKNETPQVMGYNSQSPEAIDLVNRFKAHEATLGALWREAKASGLADPRMLAVAKTDLQKAYMVLNRAVFQPTDFFE